MHGWKTSLPVCRSYFPRGSGATRSQQFSTILFFFCFLYRIRFGWPREQLRRTEVLNRETFSASVYKSDNLINFIIKKQLRQ